MKTTLPVKPEHVTWTDDQWKAIMAKDQDILVAAAAGSGKTAVLVERIIQKIIAEENPINVDELLVVTFTNASAAEMKHRIGEALEKAIDANPTSSHLRKQLGLLNSAHISTLHSFCLEVVRKHYYMVDIDPGFRIADQTEADLLRDEVLDELFETEYGKEDNIKFFQLVDTFTNDRTDIALQTLITKLYDFAHSHPEPVKWLNNVVDMYDVNEHMNIEELPFMQVIMDDIFLQLAGAKQLIQQALELTKIPGGPDKRAENYIDDIAIVDKLIDAASNGWDNLYEVMNDWSFSRAKTCKGDEYIAELIKEADNLRKSAKAILDKLKKDFFSRRPETYLRDIAAMKGVIFQLVEVVKTFSIQFEKKKAEKGLVDFSDLEHLCLQILMDKSGDNSVISPSEIAKGYKKLFKEVLVDEYQDTNMVQETILYLVSADGEYDGNLFMVGDVKQSIYRFRLAEPKLFLSKYLRFTKTGENSGLRIDLSRNFRSRKEVLDGVNFIFKQIMGPNVGGIDYSEDVELVKGSGYPDEEEFPIEVLLIDQADDSTDEQEESIEDGLNRVELEKAKLEARCMAQKIRGLIDQQAQIYDLKTKTKRNINYKDIVILVRSLSWVPDIMEEFKHAGIPVYANMSTGYFEATEVAIMLSLLRVIDNPDQDIPLASVLRSPIVGLTEEQLAYIRLQSKKGSYYDAVKAFIQNDSPKAYEQTFEHIVQLFEKLEGWRTMARSGALSDLIWQLYRDTGFYEFVGGLPSGKQRQANLRSLYDRARQYEETSFRGLFRFLRFIDRMRDRGNDLGVARAIGEQEDVVRVMTIHSSKGLEFPVVFVSGIARKFNFTDINSSYLFDKEFGFASKYIDPVKRISYPSLPELAFKRKERVELIAEEMRILYVALTRAKEKLYLIGTVANVEKSMERWMRATQHDTWLLPEYDRIKANTYLDWIGVSLVRHRDAENIRKADVENSDHEISNHPSRWDIKIISKLQLLDEMEQEKDTTEWFEAVREGKPVAVETDYKDTIYERLNWNYSHPLATKRMSKQSVTELKRMAEQRDEASSTQLIKPNKSFLFNRPKFMSDKGELSPAERGTAMHTVMQHISMERQPTIESVKQLMAELVEKEILTNEQADAITVDQIIQFFETDLGKRIITAQSVQREVPFTIGIPAREIYSNWDGLDENVLVQGIIDCVMEDENGITLIDYKTDVIQGKFPGGFSEAKPILKKRYEVQIAFYTRALEQILGKTVAEKYLYFFDSSDFIKM
nr:helicase-exonuclease AddAB subunit AddA [Paenibacillus bovis]